MRSLNVVKDLAEKIRQMKLAIDELGELGEPLSDINMIEERIPLTNKSYEQTLLGGLMLDNSKTDMVMQRVNSCHFGEYRNADIFSAMKRLYKKNNPIDTLSIMDELNWSGCKETEKYLFDLAKKTSGKAIPHLPSIANVVMMDSHERGKK